MKQVAFVAGCALLLAASAVGAPNEAMKEYVIKVTSSIPDRSVEFEGAYLFNGSDPSLHTVRKSTPFEVRSNGALGMGMFRKTKGDAQLVVEVIATEDGKTLNSSCTVDDGVIFGQNLVVNGPSFTHSFTWARR